ncbi:KGG domain-containing protein [Pseudomonas sp. HR96]|uniref:general stress protein n=1 Tax=Pseudomonas sp. HR96 TaxID=1027966 RepID=UPI002A75EAB5|nr:KGG domain-containing protein [Pseudomonas sp. HR96]WPP01532.1 KGG domain-containing protein [Pseudomonas sp. HR96]
MANTGNNNPGNFANDKQKASEAGQKGGQASTGTTRDNNTGNNQQGNQTQRDQGQKGGQGQGSGGNFANDREKASQAGQKGGQHSHDNDRK